MEVRFEIGFTQHPKIVAAGPLGRDLFIAAIDHATLNLTDGFVSSDQLDLLADYRGILLDSDLALPGIGETVKHQLLAERLMAVGLFNEVPGGYVIHDYADFQVTRQKLFGALDFLERKRERDASRKRRVRGQDERPRTTDSSGSVSSDLAGQVQDSAALPLSQDPNTEPLVRLAEQVRGVDQRTIPAWLSAAGAMPLEWAAARALESLQRRRELGPLRNEAGYVTKTLQQLRAERAA